MAHLIRVEGQKGSMIYSGAHYSLEEAKEDYLNEKGYEAEKVDEFAFDGCSANDLRVFALSGNE